MAQVKVYGADWCGMTRRTLQHLDILGVEYEYIDVETNPSASAWVKEQNGGKEKKPTLEVGGKTLSEPSNSELEVFLRSCQVIA